MFDIPKFLVMAAWPKLAKLLGITFLDKKITEFFMNIVRTTMENRRYVYPTQFTADKGQIYVRKAFGYTQFLCFN